MGTHPKMFTFAGWSGSGKTTLIGRLIEKFTTRSKRVIAVKGVHEYSLQPQAKDSHRFLDAGARRVYVISDGEILNMEKIKSSRETRHLLEKGFKDCDIVLLEGYYLENVPIIEVVDVGKNPRLKFPEDKLAAVIGDKGLSRRIPCFNNNELDKIIEFMEAYGRHV